MPVIAIDLGATKSAAAVFDEQGNLLFAETQLLEKRKGKEVSELLLKQIQTLLNKAYQNNFSISAIGICVPGIAYAATGKTWCPNIPHWEDFPLLEELQSGIRDKKIKIKIDSDRACYILGEVWKGNAQNCSDAIFLSVGTGIGAGILVNNQVLRGANDIAGAIGWMGLDRPFHEKYIQCGCFEYNASGEGIVKFTKELIASGSFINSELMKISLDNITARNVFEAFEKNDPLSKFVIRNAIECWGMAVANLVSLFNPEKIIFGGGIFGPALKFLDEVYAEAKKWAQPISIKQVSLEASALGSEAGLYGAAWLAMKD
ncbi:MAG: ROK family protein [Bacteroidetes bacterium]|nr:ROK family protein [Bacteroidota bacterium]MBS1631759.1 ROK family protein [Bacteroidota bacterium]